MLFESFDLSISYRNRSCDLTIRESYEDISVRKFEIVQGGITIFMLSYLNGDWVVNIMEDLHPVVKQDTEDFVSQELIKTLGLAIRAHYQLFKADKIRR